MCVLTESTGKDPDGDRQPEIRERISAQSAAGRCELAAVGCGEAPDHPRLAAAAQLGARLDSPAQCEYSQTISGAANPCSLTFA